MDFELYYQTSGVCIDTRKIEKDCLFVCIKGGNFDGNTFAEKALELGAKYVVVDNPEYAKNEYIFLVDDSLSFLQKLANYHRNKFSIPIIGITGSNGKTTSKELISLVLSQKYNVLSTIGNLNNHIGVPLTLLRLTIEHEIAVIEMGANKPGDIQELCDIAEPNFGIITNIGKAHLEGFKNFEGVLNTKTELYRSILTKEGLVFVNGNDSVLMNHLPKHIHYKTYGDGVSFQTNGTLIELNPFVKFNWFNDEYRSKDLQTQMIGKYNYLNFLAAACIGSFFEVDFDLISKALVSYLPTNNRSQIDKTDSNTLIMDAYNANPSSMKLAIESFSDVVGSNKIMILGDMFELGTESISEHQNIVDLVKSTNIKSFFIGKNFNATKKSNLENNFFENKVDFESYLNGNPIKESLILIKGSRGIGLETVVKCL